MHRIDTPTAASTLPSANPPGTAGYWINGNPSTGTPPTQADQDFFNAIQEELIAVLAAGGVTPVKGTYNQVLAAIKELIQQQIGSYAIDTGAVNAYAITLNPPVTALTNGLTVRFKTLYANTGAAQLNVGPGLVAITDAEGNALTNGEIPAGMIVTGVYDSAAAHWFATNIVPPGIVQSGSVTAGHIAKWIASGQVGDGGVLGALANLGTGNTVVAVGGNAEIAEPVSAQAGINYSFAAGDRGYRKLRSNSGTAMADTLPGTSPGVLAAGWKCKVQNTDAAALLVVSAGSGAALNGTAGGSVTIYPGATAEFGCDGSNYFCSAAAARVTPQGRLTLVTGTPVMNANETAKTTIYYTPYFGNMIPIAGAPTPFAEISAALDATNFLSGSLYDLFVFNNAGVITLGYGPAWTNSTTRSAAISLVNGVWVNSAAITLRNSSSSTTAVAAGQATYVGTVYATANGQTGMNFAPAAASGGAAPVLGLWNAYNRVRVTAINQDNTSSWSYSTATWRPADNSTSNRVSWVDGLGHSGVAADYACMLVSSSSSVAFIGVDFNSTSAAPAAPSQYAGAGGEGTVLARAVSLPVMGFNYAQAVEYGAASTTTFDGVNSSQQAMTLTVSLEM
jgi:hypothetical protein